MVRSYLMAFSSLIALAAVTGEARAQAGPASPPAQQVEEIVVTAQRVEENLQKAPVAVTAISGQEALATGSRDVADLGRLAPNVSIGTQSAAPTPAYYIRGIGQDRQGLSFDEGVGLYIDDIYYARSQGADPKLLDVDRVEIRRGPQGTLFGRNNIGGNIDFLTKQPSEQFGGYVDGTYGSYNRVDLDGTINAPIAKNLFLKVTGGTFNQDGYIKHLNDSGSNGGGHSQAVRVQVRWLVTDKLTVDLGVNFSHDRTTGEPVVITAANPNASYVKAAAAHGQPLFTSAYVAPGKYQEYGGGPNDHYNDTYYGGSLKIQYDLTSDIKFKSITGFSHNHELNFFNYTESIIPLFLQGDNFAEKSVQQENQVIGRMLDGKLNWVAGFFYFHESPTYAETSSDYTSYPARLSDFLRLQAQTVNSYAGYGQISYKLFDRLTATAGVRYTDESKSVTITTPNVVSIGGGLFGENGLLIGANSASFANTSPHLALEYQWTSSFMTYASATEGFRSGGFNVNLNPKLVDNGALPYSPETLWNYEGGIRSELFDHRLRLNLTGFYQKYKNLQLTAVDLAIATPAVPTPNEIINVGREHQSGVELEAEAVVTRDFTLRGEFSTLSAHYDSLGAAAGIGTPPLTLNSNLARAPHDQGSVGGRYTFHLPDSAKLVLNADVSWTAHQYSNPTPSNQAYLPAYSLIDARLTYTPPHSSVSVSVFGTNLANKYYYVGGVDFGREGIIGMDQRVVGAPREVGANIRAVF